MTTASETVGPLRGRLREALDNVLKTYTPFRPMSARDTYELVLTNAFTARGLYLSLGYWKTARTIDQACEAPAALVGNTAAMGGDDEVVDFGFVFADQDVLWMQRFAPRRITGPERDSLALAWRTGSSCWKARPPRCGLPTPRATSLPRSNARFISTRASAPSPKRFGCCGRAGTSCWPT